MDDSSFVDKCTQLRLLTQAGSGETAEVVEVRGRPEY
jgi:hypothetical protein